VQTSSLPSATVGRRIVARISNSNPDTCTVLEMRAAHWAGGQSPRDDAAEIANDGLWPPFIFGVDAQNLLPQSRLSRSAALA
jgi:hypothetical protein